MMRVDIKEDKKGVELVFQNMLRKSQELIQKDIVRLRIKEAVKYREDKAYNISIGQSKNYLESMWNHTVEGNSQLPQIIQFSTEDRINSIIMDLQEKKLEIPQRQLPSHDCDHDNIFAEQFKQKIGDKKQQKSEEAKQKEKDIYKEIYSEEKKKKTKQFVREQRRKQRQRKRQWQKIQQKREESFKMQDKELKEEEQKQKLSKRKQILVKQKQRHKMRDQQRVIRQERLSEYLKVKEKLNQHPPLYQKLYRRYQKDAQKSVNQRFEKMGVQRKHLLEHLTRKQFEEHERKYQQFREVQEKEREERRKLIREQNKHRSRNYSSVDFSKGVDERQIYREQAKQRRVKMLDYEKKVKQEYKPKIDDEKRRQLLNLIQKFEISHKKVKNVKIENGELYYENLNNVDPQMIGNEYLESVREMVSKGREKRKNKSQDLSMEASVKKKKVDYLEWLKQERKNQTSGKKVNKRAYLDNNNMSYEQKLNRVLAESLKLSEDTKLKEQKLKYGKFKTAEQILAHKWQIDKNYIDMANMKLKLIQ